METKKAMGLVIRERRRDLRLTQTELAAELGVSQAAVSDWERGACNPSFAQAWRLAEFLGLTLDQMAGRGPTARAG